MAINVADALSGLQHKAMHDKKLAERFLAVRNTAEPLKAFCALYRECGYEIYEMDVIVYCQDMLDKLDLDVDEIVNSKMDQNEAKYPVEKALGKADKYTNL